MNQKELTTVTYNLPCGAKVVQPITDKAFEGGKKGNKTSQEMLEMFQDTAWDKRASSFSLEGMDDVIVEPKVREFTKAEVKAAKRDYKEIQKANPAGFANQLQQFKSMVVDKFTNNQRRLRFNLSNLEVA